MCGILGISFQKGCTVSSPQITKYILQELFLGMESRGTNATGVAFISGDKISVLKNNVRAKEFVNSKEFCTSCWRYIKTRHSVTLNDSNKTISIIGHCRAKTKGSSKIRHNNHPIIANNIIGIHNGIIGNDEQIFRKYQILHPSFERHGQVDSEIIFRLIDHFIYIENKSTVEAVAKVVSLIVGSYACVFVDKTNPHQLWLFRDQLPIKLFVYESTGLIVFASTKECIENAVCDLVSRSLGKPSEFHIPRQHCAGLNLYTNSFCLFKMRDKIDDGMRNNYYM